MTGRKNIGFENGGEEFPLPPNLPPPGVPISSYAIKDTPFIVNPLDSEYLPEHTYLAPRVAGYNTDEVIQKCQRENVYDALGKYHGDCGHGGEAMRKANLVYESSAVVQKKPRRKSGPKSKRNGCCVVLCLIIIGLLALGAFVVTLLQFFGMLKCGQYSTSTVGASSSGRLGPAPINAPDNSSLYLEERLALLEANITSLKVNITSLKERMISQETELGQLRNLTKGYRGQMKTLEDRLAEEERKSKNLNESVIALSNMQQTMQATTSTVNITLSSSIDSLQKQTSSQETKITSVDTHIIGNFTSLASMIAAEATIRELNDSRLRSELVSNAHQQADTMSSLSARLTALNETTRQGLTNVKTSVQSLAGNLTRSVVNLDLTDQNLLYQLTSLRMNLSNQISNISLTPGPQGPAGTNGVGNLTACSVQTTSGFASSSQTVTRVHYTVPSDQVLTGAYCYADKKGVYTEYDKSNIQCKCSSHNMTNMKLFGRIYGNIMEADADAAKYKIHRSSCRRDALFKIAGRDKKLVGNILASVHVANLALCARQCTSSQSCQTINYKKQFSGQELNCQLLNVTMESEEVTLTASTGWMHYAPVLQLAAFTYRNYCGAHCDFVPKTTPYFL
eukprot:gene14996-16543_t